MRRIDHLIVFAVLAALVATGCGSSDGDSQSNGATATATTPAAPPGAAARYCGPRSLSGTEQLRVTGTGCDIGRRVVATWARESTCASQIEASRFACSVRGGYRCLGVATDRGIAISCARSGSSVSFLVSGRAKANR